MGSVKVTNTLYKYKRGNIQKRKTSDIKKRKSKSESEHQGMLVKPSINV